MRHRSVLVSLVVVALALTVPTSALGLMEIPDLRATRPPARENKALAPSISAYKALGSWIDMFNRWPWDNPGKAAKAMARKGVTTLYLETSNYSKANDIYRPTQMSALVEAAHANGMDVVAWYVPGFKNMKKDKRRSRAAIDFVSTNGESFDSFALDIEATVVRDMSKRNARAIRLSKLLRSYVGPSYPLGAIVPEAGALYWPGFPYSEIRGSYDVFLPMAYYTYRVQGAPAVRSFTARNVDTILDATGDPEVPIHVIGGLGGVGTAREAKAFANKLLDKGAIGGSFYDFPITTNAEWKVLARLAR